MWCVLCVMYDVWRVRLMYGVWCVWCVVCVVSVVCELGAFVSVYAFPGLYPESFLLRTLRSDVE